MSENVAEVSAGEGAAAPEVAIYGGAEELSLADAMALYGQSEAKEPDESALDATPVEESADEADAAPPEKEATSEETQEDDPAKEPPLELPRSWTKDQNEHWAKLDRATQEYLLEHDRKVSEGVRRSQNELAEARKIADSETAKARELTKTLAAKLPELEAAAQDFFENKYPEFKTYDDVVNMARQADALSATDPFTALALGNRVKAWEADQQRIAQKLATAREAKSLEARTELEEFAKFVNDENGKLSALLSAADIKTYTPKAPEFYRELGFSDEDRAAISNGKKYSPFDSRFQRMAFEAMKYREIINAPKAVAKKELPPVQRPGAAQPKGAQNAANVQALTRKLDSSGSVDDAFELFLANQRRAS